MSHPDQRRAQLPEALERPPQRRLGIPAGVAGSISRSRSSTTDGSVSMTRRRPPPDRRTCPRSSRSPDSTSANPRRTVSSESPVTRASSATPPGPCILASLAAHNRRRRSSHSAPNKRQRSATFASAARSSAAANRSGFGTPLHSPPAPKPLSITPRNPTLVDQRALTPLELGDLLVHAFRPACARAAYRAPSEPHPCAAFASRSDATCTAPSRRSSSPTSPGWVHASASARIRALYFAVNDRRFACSTSSGVRDLPPPARRARQPRIPARLRQAGLRGRRRPPQPLLQLHSCSSPTCPTFLRSRPQGH